MARILSILLLAFALAAPAVAARVAIPESTVTFEAPAGYTALAGEEIAVKFPPNAPRYVVGDARRISTVAYDIKPIALNDSDLEVVLQAMAQGLSDAVPGLEWKERKLINLAGQRWAYLELTSSAADTDIHNIMLVTHHGGRMLVFNFNSTREAFPAAEASLRASIASIDLGAP